MVPGASESRHVENAWLVLVHGQHVTPLTPVVAPADRYIGNVLADLEVSWQSYFPCTVEKWSIRTQG